MLTNIFETILSGLGVVADLLIRWFLSALDLNLSTYLDVFPFLSTVYDVLQGFSFGLLALIAGKALASFWFGSFDGSSAQDRPVGVLAKAFAGAIGIYWGGHVLAYLVQLGTVPYEKFRTADVAGNALSSFSIVNFGARAAADVLEFVDPTGVTQALDFGTTLLELLLLILILINLFKLVIEVCERYLIVGVLVFTSPLIYCTLPSRETSSIFKRWVSMFVGSILQMSMSVIFLKLIVSGLIANVANSEHGMLNMLLVLAMTKIAQRVDTYLQQLGVGVATTGGSMVDDFMGLVHTAISMFGRSGGSPSGAVMGAGAAAAGGLGGLAKRIAKGNVVGAGVGGFIDSYRNGTAKSLKDMVKAGKDASRSFMQSNMTGFDKKQQRKEDELAKKEGRDPRKLKTTGQAVQEARDKGATRVGAAAAGVKHMAGQSAAAAAVVGAAESARGAAATIGNAAKEGAKEAAAGSTGVKKLFNGMRGGISAGAASAAGIAGQTAMGQRVTKAFQAGNSAAQKAMAEGGAKYNPSAGAAAKTSARAFWKGSSAAMQSMFSGTRFGNNVAKAYKTGAAAKQQAAESGAKMPFFKGAGAAAKSFGGSVAEDISQTKIGKDVGNAVKAGSEAAKKAGENGGGFMAKAAAAQSAANKSMWNANENAHQAFSDVVGPALAMTGVGMERAANLEKHDADGTEDPTTKVPLDPKMGLEANGDLSEAATNAGAEFGTDNNGNSIVNGNASAVDMVARNAGANSTASASPLAQASEEVNKNRENARAVLNDPNASEAEKAAARVTLSDPGASMAGVASMIDQESHDRAMKTSAVQAIKDGNAADQATLRSPVESQAQMDQWKDAASRQRFTPEAVQALKGEAATAKSNLESAQSELRSAQISGASGERMAQLQKNVEAADQKNSWAQEKLSVAQSRSDSSAVYSGGNVGVAQAAYQGATAQVQRAEMEMKGRKEIADREMQPVATRENGVETVSNAKSFNDWKSRMDGQEFSVGDAAAYTAHAESARATADQARSAWEEAKSSGAPASEVTQRMNEYRSASQAAKFASDQADYANGRVDRSNQTAYESAQSAYESAVQHQAEAKSNLDNVVASAQTTGAADKNGNPSDSGMGYYSANPDYSAQRARQIDEQTTSQAGLERVQALERDAARTGRNEDIHAAKQARQNYNDAYSRLNEPAVGGKDHYQANPEESAVAAYTADQAQLSAAGDRVSALQHAYESVAEQYRGKEQTPESVSAITNAFGAWKSAAAEYSAMAARVGSADQYMMAAMDAVDAARKNSEIMANTFRASDTMTAANVLFQPVETVNSAVNRAAADKAFGQLLDGHVYEIHGSVLPDGGKRFEVGYIDRSGAQKHATLFDAEARTRMSNAEATGFGGFTEHKLGDERSVFTPAPQFAESRNTRTDGRTILQNFSRGVKKVFGNSGKRGNRR